MRSDDVSTSQRVSRILDAARSAATSQPASSGPASSGSASNFPASTSNLGSPSEPDDIWPASWPPGTPDQPPRPAGPGWAERFTPGSGVGAPRWAVSGRGAAVVGGLALLIVVIMILFQFRGSPSGTVAPDVPVSFATPSTGAGTGLPGEVQTTGPVGAALGDPAIQPTGPAQATAGLFRVYVVGQVGRPGVVSLAPGSRVEDAVDAAGGATSKADLTVMNLARKVVDGERIMVPRPGQQVPTDDPVDAGGGSADGGAGSGAAGTPGPGAPVDLNTATVAEFDALPGIGPVLAARIVAWRQQNGRFNTVDDLSQVSGIGDATMARLRPLVRV